MIRVKCPNCGRSIKGSERWAGRKAQCPNCNTEVRFPKASVESAPAVEALAAPVDASLADESFVPSTFTPDLPQSPAISPAGGAAEVPVPREVPSPRPSPGSADRAGRGRWSLVAVAISALVVGYFIGRAHTKYQGGKSAASVASNKRDDSAPSERGRSAPSDSKASRALKVESIASKVTEANETWQRQSWVLKVRNEGDASETFNATVQWVDKDGFVIDEAYEYRLPVPAKDVAIFQGNKLLKSPGADKVASVLVKISK